MLASASYFCIHAGASELLRSREGFEQRSDAERAREAASWCPGRGEWRRGERRRRIPPDPQDLDATIMRMLRTQVLGWVVLTLLFVVLLSPAFAFAAELPTIVPEDCRGADAATKCDICDVAQLAQNALNAGIYIAVFLSAILFAWAGWKYVSAGGDTGKVKSAREIFTNVLIGLVIILAGWLVVDTIMKTFVSDTATLGPWNEIC